MHVTFVKKILANGDLCKKCQEVSDRLEADGLLSKIDHIAIADERDPDSEGIQLANQHNVTRAPFFIVKDDTGEEVFDIYFKFKAHISS